MSARFSRKERKTMCCRMLFSRAGSVKRYPAVFCYAS